MVKKEDPKVINAMNTAANSQDPFESLKTNLGISEEELIKRVKKWLPY
jgi:DNA-binding Lrp family transcriptional regulator